MVLLLFPPESSVSTISLYMSVFSLLTSLGPHFSNSALMLSTPALFPSF